MKKRIFRRTAAFFLAGALMTSAMPLHTLAAEQEYVSIESSASAESGAESSYEKTTAFVDRLYSVILGRAADSAGLHNWADQLTNGDKTAAEVVYGFVFSPEYTARNESDEAYIGMLYRTILDREADSAGLESWIKKAEIFSRRYILRGFIQSSEFTELCEEYAVNRGTIDVTENRDKNPEITSFTSNLYIQMLGRNPDPEGLNNWTGMILGKAKTLNEVILDFMGSDEFKSKNTENKAYVSSLYKGILGRNPDSAGLAGWVSQLEKGRSRFSIFIGMVKSDEFRKNCAQYGMEDYITDLSHIHATVKLNDTYRIYAGASYDSGSLGTAYKNQILNVTGVKGDWLKVSFQNNSGYIHSANVSKYEGEGIKILPVTNIPQNSNIGGAPLPTGCEATALSVLLNYLGFTKTGKNDLALNYMPKGAVGSTDPNYAFIGNPDSSHAYGVYSNGIVKTAENYFTANGIENYKAESITGSDMTALLQQVENGNPVLVWHTMNCTSTRSYGATWYLKRGTEYTEPGTGSYSFTWKKNEHCSVLVGYNKNKGTVILADVWANSGASTGGLTEYSMNVFESGYKWLGNQAVIIAKE